jgi:hypothetical protein
MYMKLFKVIESKENKGLFPDKSIYELVQSVRKFYTKLIEVFKSVGFSENKSDPCLL